MLAIGKRVQSGPGEVLILDVKKDYLVLAMVGDSKFIIARGYEYENGRLYWAQGEYYENLDDLIANL